MLHSAFNTITKLIFDYDWWSQFLSPATPRRTKQFSRYPRTDTTPLNSIPPHSAETGNSLTCEELQKKSSLKDKVMQTSDKVTLSNIINKTLFLFEEWSPLAKPCSPLGTKIEKIKWSFESIQFLLQLMSSSSRATDSVLYSNAKRQWVRGSICSIHYLTRLRQREGTQMEPTLTLSLRLLVYSH